MPDCRIERPLSNAQVPVPVDIRVEAPHGCSLFVYALDEESSLYFPTFVEENPEGLFKYSLTIDPGRTLTISATITAGGSGSDSSDNVQTVMAAVVARAAAARGPHINIESCYRESRGTFDYIRVVCRKQPGALGRVFLLGKHKVWEGGEWILPQRYEDFGPDDVVTVNFPNVIRIPYKVIAFLNGTTVSDLFELHL
jgi:hypothetical protein